MEEVRRSSDGELCGFVAPEPGAWRSMTVFGAGLGEHGQKVDAVAQVRAEGLASLADRWLLDRKDGEPETVVCIVEASPSGAMLALDHVAMPGVPTLWVDAAAVAAGEVWLRRSHT